MYFFAYPLIRNSEEKEPSLVAKQSFLSLRRLSFLSVVTLILFGVNVLSAHAAACSVTVDTVIDQAYVDGGSCTSIDINASVSTTWIGTTDLGGGIVTVRSGNIMTMGESSTMTLGTNDDFVIETNATATHQAADPNGLRITARNITVNGELSAAEKGCPQSGPFGGDGYGVDPATGLCGPSLGGGFGRGGGGSGLGGGGGAHGGLGGGGGSSASGGTLIYGDSLFPNTLGSSGGTGYYASAFGGLGGGIIQVTSTGFLSVNGRILTDGGIGNPTNSSYNGGGGGAGGSILIHTSVLTGLGSISANGGTGGGGGGGGGGGRIAVLYNALTTFNLSAITSAGGSGGAGGGWGTGVSGANGTTYILNRTIDDGAGTLTINSGFDFNTSGDYTRDVITIAPGASLRCSSVGTLTVSSTAWLSFDNITWSCPYAISSFNLGSLAGISTTNTSLTFSALGDLSVTAPVWTNVTTTISATQSGSHATFAIGSNLILRDFAYTGGNQGSVDALGGLLTFPNAFSLSLVSSTLATGVSSTQLTALMIDALSTIDASSKGCSGSITTENGFGPDPTTGICAISTAGFGFAGNPGGGGGGGAAHGGTGGTSVAGGGAQLTTYDSSTAPLLPGSGGGGGYWLTNGASGAGGGRIHLIISGTATVDGIVQSNGGNGTYVSWNGGGGGSGGSIYIRANTLTGSGSLTADGGDGGSIGGGGGGGGRIALAYSALSFSGSSSSALGLGGTGAGDGTAGSISTLLLNVAPSFPASLGQPSLVTGASTSTNTPRFTFSLADPDIADTVRYQIQIDDSSDFGSPLVDYTSSLAAQSERTFQVGQAAGSGTYTVGAENQTLSDGSYYWRVKTIDAAAAASSYTNARLDVDLITPLIAFVVDATPRTVDFNLTESSGSEGTTSVDLQVDISSAHFEDVVIPFTVTGGTATGGGTDYTLANGSVTILAGDTSTSIHMTVANDSLDENDETVIVTLSEPSSGVNTSLLTDVTHTYTITDNDAAPSVTLSSTPSPIAETADGISTITATLSVPSGKYVTTTLLFAGTATGNGTDYTTSSQQIVIAPGDLTGSLTVTAISDSIDEPGETIIASIDSVENGTDASTPETITITDNDTAGITVSESTLTLTEDTGFTDYTYVLDTQPTSTVRITFATSTNGVTLNQTFLDFTDSNWNVPQPVRAIATDDLVYEGSHTSLITHTISVPSGYAFGYEGLPLADVTTNITDNDLLGVTISPVTGSATEGAGTASYAVVLTSQPTSTVTIALTADPSSVSLSAPTLSFTDLNWNDAQTVTVTAVENAIDEPTYTTSVTHLITSSGITGYTSGLVIASASIERIDDDATPTIAISDVSISEAAGTVTVTSTMTGLSSQTVTVTYNTANGTALAASDYTAVIGGTLTWNPGETGEKALVITLTNDTPLYEQDENFVVNLTSPSNADIADGSATITVLDADAPPSVVLSEGSATIAEAASSMVLTATLSAISALPTTVFLTYAGTATGNGTDYTTSSASIVIPAGVIASSTTITAVQDATDELDETIIADISSITNGTEAVAQQQTITITDDDVTAINFTSIAAAATADSATITWVTDVLSSSRVAYGPSTSYGALTSIQETSPRVLAHTVTLSDLVSCSTYHYKVASQDIFSNAATSTDETFTTTGCVVNTPTVSETGEHIIVATGGSASLTQGTSSIKFDLPSAFTASSTAVDIQVRALDGATVLASIGSPTSYVPIGSNVFAIQALSDSTTTIDTFIAPITVKMSYVPSDLTGINVSTLLIYHYRNNAWEMLSGCSVNTEEYSVTCTTTNFSTFAMFGQRTVVAAGAGGGSGNASGGTPSPVSNIISIPPPPAPSVPIRTAPISTEPVSIIIVQQRNQTSPQIPSTAPANTQVVTILNPTDVMSLVEASRNSRNFQEEGIQSTRIRKDAKEMKVTLSEENAIALTNFVTYGISEQTRALGSGERRALIRDAFETMKTAQINPADLERLTRGIIPAYRNIEAERQQLPHVRQTFRALFGHDPNFQNASENLAWNTLMYRIRFPRDLAAERQGILAFRETFHRAPQDPFQWAVVRVQGYIKK